MAGAAGIAKVEVEGAFDVGALVRLKSDGPAMTVIRLLTKYGEPWVMVAWHVGGDLLQDEMPEAALVATVLEVA